VPARGADDHVQTVWLAASVAHHGATFVVSTLS